ncbi:MAG: DUF2851 family protein [Bacteroidia bacterium]
MGRQCKSNTTNYSWFHHGHHTNKAFSKIILHVVYELNKPLTRGIRSWS